MKQLFTSALIQKWLVKRFSIHKHKMLKQNDILIFLYQQGYLYLVLILITFIAGVNYANNLILGFCFFISAVLCISFYLTFKQLHGLKLEMIYPEVGRAGQPLEVKIQFEQAMIALRYLYVQTEQQIHKVLLKQREQTIVLHFFPQQRGAFPLPQIRVFSLYPLGLVRAWTYLYPAEQIWIAPQPQSMTNLRQHASDPDQHALDEFHELRDFKMGDPYQAVSWKQVARGQGVLVKVFEAQREKHHQVIDYQQMPGTDHEQKLSFMMGLIELCEQQRQPYQIRLPQQLLAEGMGHKHYQQALLALAQA